MKAVPVKFLTVLLFGLCLPMAAELRGDTIILRNGKRIQGRIITQNRMLVIINTAGLRRQIRKDRIRRIRYGSTTTPIRRASAVRKPARVVRKRRIRPAARKLEKKSRKTAGAREPGSPVAYRARRGEPASATGTGKAIPWRSMLVPGWDRHASGSSIVGGFWFGAFLAGAGLAAGARNDYARRRDAIAAENNIWNSLSLNGDTNLITLNILTRRERFRELDGMANHLRGAGIALGLLYLFNIMDAWLFNDKAPPALTTAAVPERRVYFTLGAGPGHGQGIAGEARISGGIRLTLGAMR